LQVLIDTPDTSEKSSEAALETVRELAADQVTLATGSASALVKFAHDEANRARHDLAMVRQDARHARRSALGAWCVVALLSVGVTVAVGWTASRITRANSDVRQLNEYVRKIEVESQRLLTERDTARQEAHEAQLASAQATGKLEAYVEQHDQLLDQSANRPTTRPTNLIESIAAMFSQE
jgi:hypothetical protein